MNDQPVDTIWDANCGIPAIEEFLVNLDGDELSAPEIPSVFKDSILMSPSGWQIASDASIDPFTPYLWSIENEYSGATFRNWIARSGEFFVSGLNGHGINSYGYGTVARLGKVTVAQQHSYGGVFGDSIDDGDCVNRQTELWNKFSREMETTRRDDSVETLIHFSDYRSNAEIYERSDENLGWRAVIEPLESSLHAEMLLTAANFNNSTHGLASRYLRALIEGCPQMWDRIYGAGNLFAVVDDSDEKTIHYLVYMSERTYLKREDSAWVSLQIEDSDATEGEVHIPVKSSFISEFDSAQEFAELLEKFDAESHKYENSESDLFGDSLLVQSDESTLSVAVNEEPVTASIQVLDFNEDYVDIGITWFRSSRRELTGLVDVRFDNINHAIEKLLNDLHIQLTVFECEDLENRIAVTVAVDYGKAKPLMDKIHETYCLESDLDMFNIYKIQAPNYSQIDLRDLS